MKCVNCGNNHDGEGMVCDQCHDSIRNNPGIHGNPDASMTYHPHRNDLRFPEGSIFQFFDLFVPVEVQANFPNLTAPEVPQWKQQARDEVADKYYQYLMKHNGGN
jgi:hypothetical protein